MRRCGGEQGQTKTVSVLLLATLRVIEALVVN